MDNLIIGFFVSFVITYVSIPVIIRIAKAKKLVDVPDSRKIHKAPVPSLGGFGIFAGFLLAMLIAVPSKSSVGIQYIVAAAFLVYMLGLKDDVMIITPMKKFIGQLAAAFIIINLANIRLTSLNGVFGIYELPYAVSLVISYFAVILIINAFNLIDGVDGLAGTLGIISSLIFGIYFYFAGDPMYAVMGLSLTGGLGAFLVFNYTPAKIFMGDTGSMLVGLVNAIMVLHFINVASSPGALVPVASAPAVGLAILAVPLFDTLRVFMIRIFLHRRSPFTPDRNHIHHLLLDCGCSHPICTATLAVYNLLLIVGVFALRAEGNYLLLLGLTLLSLSFVGVVAYFRKPANRPIMATITGIEPIIPVAEGLALQDVSTGITRKSGSLEPQKNAVIPSPIHPVFSMEEE
jgi:UDP-GlcNAc:undecaprenyl-phosphate/decaprenyl-phosphate GlcNAc-1-phosphate transferase